MKNKIRLVILFSTILFLILAAGTSVSSDTGVYIKEVCPHNQTVMYDTVGEYSDYIILSNKSAAPLSLLNYRLSDDPADPGKYMLPDVRLLPGESVTVWAATPSFYNEYLIHSTDLYTRFSLHDGETLFLTDTNGMVRDKVTLEKTEPDQRFVRNADLSGWNIVSSDDPFKSFAEDEGNPDAPVFSASSGYYDDSFSLEIISSGKIFYTEDGSDPRKSGIPYLAPIKVADRSSAENLYAGIKEISVYDGYVPDFPVDKATVIRAVSLDDKGRYSAVRTAVYFVGKDIRSRYSGSYTLSLVADPDDLFSEDSGIYVNGKIWDLNKDNTEIIEKMKNIEDGFEPTFLPVNYNKGGKGWHRNADITLFDDQCKYVEATSARIKIHGYYSRLETQKSFTLFPISEDRILKSLPICGDTALIRRGNGDETGVRDVLCSEMIQDLNLSTCHHFRCNLFINGEYWGCYVLTERMDESYIADRYNVDKDNVIIAKNWGVDSDNEEDIALYESLKQYIRNSDPADQKDYEALCKVMDMENVIDYYCPEIYLNNIDFIWNNVVLWRVRTPGSGKYEDGKWRFLINDLDDTCSSPEDDTFEELINSDNPQFFSKLCRNGGFRDLFISRFTELEKSAFSPDRAESLLDKYESEYSKDMLLSNKRYISCDYYSSDYHDQIEQLKIFFNKRPRFINNYLNSHLSLSP